ncbi:hypothetical protein AU374_01921 [Cupriavidus metallidurans]|jgi:hypothetical protein|nr:hypothetical protein AU374_01921 [Cupriavidus metallidurans]
MTAAEFQQFFMQMGRALAILSVILFVVIRLACPHENGKK